MSNSNNTLIIYDWDDTLFPTSWVNINSIRLENNKFMKIFDKFDFYILSILKKSSNFGIVVIVTNALLTWIYSCLSILPKTFNFIKKNKIEIISARESYVLEYPSSNWKVFSFRDVATRLCSQKNVQSIISVGDSLSEYYALVNLRNWQKCSPKYRILKSIKFLNYSTYRKENSYNMLIDQLKVLYKNLEKINIINDHMDLVFSLKKN